MDKLKDKIDKELQLRQLRHNDAPMRSGATTGPVATAEGRLKEEEAKQKKAEGKWRQASSNQEPASRPAVAATADEELRLLKTKRQRS